MVTDPLLKPGRNVYLGLFFITLSTLMFEVLLTRIFSVTSLYHFAFVAISMAMFGMTVGSLSVYLFPRYFPIEKLQTQLGVSAFIFSLTILLAFFVHLLLPFYSPQITLSSVASMLITLLAVAFPFFWSGICVCLTLSRYENDVARLYAVDLLGAGIGCVVLLFAFNLVGNGPALVFLAALLAMLGAWFYFGAAPSLQRFRFLTLAIGMLFLAVVTVQALRPESEAPIFELRYVQGKKESPLLYERWNSFSRVTVEAPEEAQSIFAWGLSSTYKNNYPIEQKIIKLDANAATPLERFSGDIKKLEHLRFDVTNFAHYLRPNSDVVVVGVGGGRDVLSALAFDQRSVLGIEINEKVLGVTNRVYGDFSGHLHRNPKVSMLVDEARSYLARESRLFDLIQISLIDTWAATSAGGFVLTENSLYTLEAWRSFLKRLTPNGILSVSRWYFPQRPGELYRLVALAGEALLERNITAPREHIMLVANKEILTADRSAVGPDGIGSILVSPTPFTKEDQERALETARALRFEPLLIPGAPTDQNLLALTDPSQRESFILNYPINISPPTDDSPFFFNMLRLKDFSRPELLNQGAMTFNMKAINLLGTLAIAIAILTLLCIFAPLGMQTRKESIKGCAPLLLFFSAIGFGFMMVEISQMQRLNIFLGHPVYGLSVVLVTLLISTGLGSYITSRIGTEPLAKHGGLILCTLLAVLLLFGALTPHLISAFAGAETPIRILLAVLILAPLGVVMGMPFPLGITLAGDHKTLIPWLWGINGATSVCASVFAVVVALFAGISASFWSGVGCYLLALIALLWSRSRAKVSPL